MAYTKLSPEEKQARKEARQEAKAQELFFENLFWTTEERISTRMKDSWIEPDDACYTIEEAMMMVKLAYEAGKAAS